jgi:hypothetical protein
MAKMSSLQMGDDGEHHTAPWHILPPKTDDEEGGPHQSMDESGQGPRRAAAVAEDVACPLGI